MPLDTCITNVGEYYSSHYLDSTFAKDIKGLMAQWKEQGSQAAPRRLQRLSDLFFVLARVANDGGRADVLWKPGGDAPH